MPFTVMTPRTNTPPAASITGPICAKEDLGQFAALVNATPITGAAAKEADIVNASPVAAVVLIVAIIANAVHTAVFTC